MPATSARRTLRRALALLGAAALVAPLAPSAAAVRVPERASVPAVATTDPAAPTATIPATFFRAGTFNVLGADHTAPGGKRKGWDLGAVRVERVAQLLSGNDIDLVGFQEFQPPQATRFAEVVGDSWRVYPGVDPSTGAPSVNSIGWRTDTWTLVEAHTLPVPYFSGVPSRMPYVKLQHTRTGRQVWVFNTHNPADTRGPAQQWRDAGFQMEVDLVNQLRATSPDTPVISLGDKNERGSYYCKVAPGSGMWAANGGYADASTCTPPKGAQIDWMMATQDVFFNGYTRLLNDFVKNTSDHPLYFANAVVPASTPPTLDHVVVVAVPGLTSSAVRSLGSQVSELTSMTESGASTLNARTTAERTTADANLVSVLTGRRVQPRKGGHGVGFKRKLPATVEQGAGQYVSGVFDLAHNNSLRTAFTGSRPELDLVRKSWNKKNGGTDPYGADDGTAKLDRQRINKHDRASLQWWRKKTEQRADHLTVLELSAVLKAGERHGYRGPKYKAAIVKVDKMIARVRRTVQSHPEMRDRTMLVVTGTHGALRKKNTRAWRQSYRVPLWVTGPGVAPGADLYALNPGYADPRGAQQTYGGAQPIRTGDVANLVTRALGVPPVPGSTMNLDQSLEVFAPAVP